MKLALLVLDMQVGLLRDAEGRTDKACEHINYVASLLRQNHHVVIHVMDTEHEGEEAAFSVHPLVEQESMDLHVRKSCSNAFWNSELEAVLKARQVDFVIVSGFAAEHSVLFTYNGAMERGFRTAILQKGVVSMHEEQPLTLYRDRFVLSYPVVEAMLGVQE
ncbi:isochorismatase family protein [Gorillibacterium sp. CAU 1737]|uniref:cysteine hydrolase family protein n=1 Tax=Gorillibacterium sp. CAU 1737 TaxID=3140362 RepID=UPI003260B8D8